jgi:hypothetical protein
MQLIAVVLLLASFGVANFSSSQQTTAPAWHREEKADPLHKLSYIQFTLEGKYLIPPKQPTIPPLLVVRCVAGSHKVNGGTANGKFLTGYLAVAAVLDFQAGRVPVEYRLDDGRLIPARWASSTDGAGAFFLYVEFNNLLYGHALPHKENTNPPVRKVVLGVPEYLGSEVEVEFDMPDPSDVADACGVIVHKK